MNLALFYGISLVIIDLSGLLVPDPTLTAKDSHPKIPNLTILMSLMQLNIPLGEDLFCSDRYRSGHRAASRMKTLKDSGMEHLGLDV